MAGVKSFKFNHDRQSQEFARRVVEALKRTRDRAEPEGKEIDMLKITEDEIKITGKNGLFSFAALGGPEDPIGLIGNGDVELSADEWNEIQAAFVNFANTGYFDREG